MLIVSLLLVAKRLVISVGWSLVAIGPLPVCRCLAVLLRHGLIVGLDGRWRDWWLIV